MGRAQDDPSDLLAQLRDLRVRVEALEGRTGAKKVTNASRPAAADAEGAVVYNVDVKRHQGSNGVNWYDFY